MVDENPNFGQEKPKKHQEKDPLVESLSNNVIELGSRMRNLEGQYSTLRNKGQLTDQNMIEYEKEVRTEVKAISQDFLEVKRLLQDLKEKINMITSELNNSVKEHDFKVVEKYLDLWNPGQFVTREQLKRKIEELDD